MKASLAYPALIGDNWSLESVGIHREDGRNPSFDYSNANFMCDLAPPIMAGRDWNLVDVTEGVREQDSDKSHKNAKQSLQTVFPRKRVVTQSPKMRREIRL